MSSDIYHVICSVIPRIFRRLLIQALIPGINFQSLVFSVLQKKKKKENVPYSVQRSLEYQGEQLVFQMETNFQIKLETNMRTRSEPANLTAKNAGTVPSSLYTPYSGYTTGLWGMYRVLGIPGYWH